MNKSKNTAKGRKYLSIPANNTSEYFGHPNSSTTILDYGCGRGADVELLAEQGYNIQGWDPYHRSEMPSQKEFDIVMCNYVLNVLETDYSQLEVLRGMYKATKVGGRVFVSARSPRALAAELSKNGNNWTRFRRGFKTRIYKDGSYTYQEPITATYLKDLLEQTGFVDIEEIATSKKIVCCSATKTKEFLICTD